MDCSKPKSLTFCPITCAKYEPVSEEPSWCKLLDCTNPEMLLHCSVFCPTLIPEPKWCKFVDCANPEASHKCTKTCKNKGNIKCVYHE